MDEAQQTMPGVICGILAFIVPFALYERTCMREPGIFCDYIKMAMVGKVWGLAHAPGFPLYLILDGLASMVPIGTLTFRVAMISVISMALASHFLYRVARQLDFAPLVALGTALLAATSYALWTQAVIADVYALEILFLLVTIWALFRWSQTGDDRWMWLGVWVFIVSLANHAAALLALPGLLIFCLVRKPRVFLRAATWFHVGAAIIVTLAFYGYIYWRSFARPIYNEYLINGDLGRFWDFVTLKEYGINMGPRPDYQSLLWSIFVGMGTDALGKIGWYAAWLGSIPAVFRYRSRALPLLLVPVAVFLGAYYYHTAEQESRLAPIYVFAVLLAVTLAVWVIETVSERWKMGSRGVGRGSDYVRQVGFTLLIIALAAGIWIHLKNNIGFLDRSGPNPDHASAVRIINAVQEPCIILSNRDEDRALQLLFCIITDPERRPSCFPYLTEENQVDTPVAVTCTWSHEMAVKAWAEGRHLYSIGLFYRVEGDTALQYVPVDTGVDPPELYEVFPEEAQRMDSRISATGRGRPDSWYRA